jgi:hypothetical protein
MNAPVDSPRCLMAVLSARSACIRANFAFSISIPRGRLICAADAPPVT